jgi:hypothetical protein
MENDLRKIIEEINSLAEDELVDEFEDVEITDTELEPANDNLTDTLEAKTKLSRALDVLKGQVEDFKNSVIEDVDLINDTTITTSFEALDNILKDIADSLGANKEEDKDVFEVEADEEIVEDDTEEEKEEDVEVDFDDEASLDLFNLEDKEEA